MKTTKAQFNTFKAEIHRLKDKWGMSDTNIQIYHKDLCGSAAQMEHFSNGRVSISLATKIGEGFEHDPIRLARHEFMHALLSQYAHLAESRYVTQDQLIGAEEAVCRMAEVGL